MPYAICGLWVLVPHRPRYAGAVALPARAHTLLALLPCPLPVGGAALPARAPCPFRNMEPISYQNALAWSQYRPFTDKFLPLTAP